LLCVQVRALQEALLQVDNGGVSEEEEALAELEVERAGGVGRALKAGAAVSGRVQVSTVDAFQGGEKDIVLLSCVRTSGNLHFVEDRQRSALARSLARPPARPGLSRFPFADPFFLIF